MDKIRFLKVVDRFLGSSLISILRRDLTEAGSSLSHATLKKILVIRPGGIGDAVLLLPAMKQIKSIYGDVQLDILCEKRNHEIFESYREINHIYLYDSGMGLINCLRNTYDVVIDTEQWHRLSAIVAYFTGAPVRIGYNTNDRGALFTDKIPYSHDDYEGQSFFNLIAPLAGDAHGGIPDVYQNGEPFIYANPVEIFSSGRSIAIAPGASVKERRWGGENFGLTARQLFDRGFNILILGAAADRAEAIKIRAYCPAAVDLTGATRLKDTASIMKDVSVLICADSGIMHVAYAVGTPTVSLFGAGIQMKWAPPGVKHRIINKRLPCSPCTKFGYTPPCDGVACLSQITVDEVVREAVGLIDRCGG